MYKKNFSIYLILSSPSGAGKTTLAKKLIKENKNFKLSISYTTRKKRPNEQNKKDYHFIDQKKFESLKKKNFFIEYAKVFDNYYGTSSAQVKKIHNSGKDVLFDIDWQGTRKIKKKLKSNIVSIFLIPPSKQELKRRLKKRAQDPEKIVKKRLSSFKNELKHWNEYDYVLVNNNLNQTAKAIITIVNAEKMKIENNEKLPRVIKTLSKRN